MNLQEFNDNVINWANERNFFAEDGATLFKQYLKLKEEFGELSGNFAKGRDMRDDIGDCAVVAVIIYKLSGHDFLNINNYWFTCFSKEDFSNIEELYFRIDAELYDISSSIDCKQLRHIENEVPNLISLLKIFAEINNYSFEECLETAWNDIKDRKGKMINNVFIKESDLKGR